MGRSGQRTPRGSCKSRGKEIRCKEVRDAKTSRWETGWGFVSRALPGSPDEKEMGSARGLSLQQPDPLYLSLPEEKVDNRQSRVAGRSVPGDSGAGAWKGVHAKRVSVGLLGCKRYALNPAASN